MSEQELLKLSSNFTRSARNFGHCVLIAVTIWSHKSEGILAPLDQQRAVCDWFDVSFSKRFHYRVFIRQILLLSSLFASSFLFFFFVAAVIGSVTLNVNFNTWNWSANNSSLNGFNGAPYTHQCVSSIAAPIQFPFALISKQHVLFVCSSLFFSLLPHLIARRHPKILFIFSIKWFD